MKYLITNLVTAALVILTVQTVRASTADTDLLVGYCNRVDGQIINEWKCPNSKKLRKEKFCVVKNEQDENLTFNGCTGASKAFGKFGSLFFKACVLHDFCYHSEPSVSGKTKKACDVQFYQNMMRICDATGVNRCKFTAKAFYRAVRIGGKPSWKCEKGDATYPQSLEDLP